MTRSLRWSVACLMLVSVSGCASERAPINRVQPNALEKSFFVGTALNEDDDDPQFYYRPTVADVDFGAAQSGLFTASWAQTTARVRWEITEDLLLARLAYASDAAPVEWRGRALSLLGGSNRMGTFVGPFVGGLVAEYAGLASAFAVQAGLAAAAAAVMFLVVPADAGRAHTEGHARPRIGSMLRDHRTTFATVGLAAVAIAVLRSTRQAVIPLWGSGLGLSASEIGIIFGLSSALDMR